VPNSNMIGVLIKERNCHTHRGDFVTHTYMTLCKEGSRDQGDASSQEHQRMSANQQEPGEAGDRGSLTASWEPAL
jgi:hypothetical protein